MATAHWNGQLLAESDDTVEVDGYTYFPRAALRMEHLRESELRSVCGWKGIAHYFDVVVGDRVNHNAAWHYPDPKEEAMMVKDRISFWFGVEIET